MGNTFSGTTAEPNVPSTRLIEYDTIHFDYYLIALVILAAVAIVLVWSFAPDRSNRPWDKPDELDDTDELDLDEPNR